MEELTEKEMTEINGGTRLMWDLFRGAVWAANWACDEIAESLKMRNGVDSGVGVQNQA